MRNVYYGTVHSLQFTSELLRRDAHFSHAHISVSHHSESVELTTAQVKEGTAALSGVAGGVSSCGRCGLNSIVLCWAALVPLYCYDIAAAVLLE